MDRLLGLLASRRGRRGHRAQERAGGRRWRAVRLLALCGAAGLVVPGVSLAVTCSVPGTHPSIQVAVDDASCTTVEVAGPRTESVTVRRSVILSGASPGTVVHGAVRVEGEGVLVELVDLLFDTTAAVPPRGAIEVGGGSRVIARRLSATSQVEGGGPPPACSPGPNTACLLDGRFRVEGTMKDFASPPRTFDTRVMEFPDTRAESDQAVFWQSFTPGNFEIGVKMVDACGLDPGHPLRNYWLFIGGLTNAASTLTVEDTVSGQRYVWRNPAGTFPRTVGDTAAFPCVDGAPSAPCAPDDATACLLDRRFKVTGVMTDFSTPPNDVPTQVMRFVGGRAESDQAVFFESFTPGNFEVGVKMVNGCSLPPDHPLRSYWVFYGGLTNAETRIVVTDTATGSSNVWENPAGALPLSEGRTGVFPCE